MSLATAELPDDPDALRTFAIACQAELKAAELSVQLRTLEIEKLKAQIAKLRRMHFGRSCCFASVDHGFGLIVDSQT
jgi:transposase